MTKDTKALELSARERKRIEVLEQKTHTLHRSVLDKAVLQGQLPIRARAAAYRSHQAEARARLDRFLASSSAYVRARADAEPLAHETRVIRLDSLTWWVPLARPDDATLVERSLGHQDFPYRLLTQTRELALGGLMIDIGANTGRMCIPRVILGDVTAAYCAEPDPLNYACLVRNARDNELEGLVLPDQVAIGSSNGTVRLMRANSAGGHRVLDHGTTTKYEVVEVESLTLDAWVDRIGIDLQQLAFVKLDAQGSEVHVLMGAPRVLECRHVVWQIEIDLPLLAKRGFVAEDMFGYLRRHFSHFVDLNRSALGSRVRPIDKIGDALAGLVGGSEGRTDVLLFTLEARDQGGRSNPREST